LARSSLSQVAHQKQESWPNSLISKNPRISAEIYHLDHHFYADISTNMLKLDVLDVTIVGNFHQI